MFQGITLSIWEFPVDISHHISFFGEVGISPSWQAGIILLLCFFIRNLFIKTFLMGFAALAFSAKFKNKVFFRRNLSIYTFKVNLAEHA